jgi:hypothetical protein
MIANGHILKDCGRFSRSMREFHRAGIVNAVRFLPRLCRGKANVLELRELQQLATPVYLRSGTSIFSTDAVADVALYRFSLDDLERLVRYGTDAVRLMIFFRSESWTWRKITCCSRAKGDATSCRSSSPATALTPWL